jgi:catechol 2,3-dioxygenase-like lactoylglutathione lyase family enzyme
MQLAFVKRMIRFACSSILLYRTAQLTARKTTMTNDKGTIDARIESISAITLATHDMGRAVRFYSALGFTVRYGGEGAAFTSLVAGSSCLNLIAQPANMQWSWWGRVIFYVSDVDAMFQRAVGHGLRPQAAPRDASWGERFFHLTDPDGHELSFARPLPK